MSNVESYLWWVTAAFPAPAPLETSELSQPAGSWMWLWNYSVEEIFANI